MDVIIKSINKKTSVLYIIHIKIDNIEERVQEMIKTISDTSRINKLNDIGKISFSANSEKTINKLVNDIFLKAENKVTKELGEYMISDSSQKALTEFLNHTKIPLAELIKEKIIGNHSFDFHSESTGNIIAFGESKYRSSGNPHGDAINQIIEFIEDKKDDSDLYMIQHFISSKSKKNYKKNKKGYIAAFSINGKEIDKIFDNAIATLDTKEMFIYPEIYLIGVEIGN